MERTLGNLRQALRDLALKLELPALWRWWAGELAPLLPSAPRTALQRRRLRPVLAFGPTTAVLWDSRVENGVVVLVEAATIPLTGDAAASAHAGRTAIEALPARGQPSGSAVKVIVALPPAQVLRKRIVLPAAVEENLLETLTYDLDRHTPFRADQLYFDATVIARDMAKKEIRVDWAAALKSAVDHVRRQAESWGATVVSVTPETLAAGGGSVSAPLTWSKLNLLPEDGRAFKAPWRRWQFWVPVALIATLAIVAIALPLWQKREFVIEVAHVTEQARVQAAAADALRQRLDLATGDYNFALGKKYAFPGSVQLLDDVTRLLPDDTWLTQLEVKNVPKGKEPHREMLIRGESVNAGRLISALEDSKVFEQAAPRSPTTKIQPGPGEVFDLGTQIIPLPPPALVAVVNPEPKGAGTDGAAPAAANPAAKAPATPGATPVAGAPSPSAATPAASGTAPASPASAAAQPPAANAAPAGAKAGPPPPASAPPSPPGSQPGAPVPPASGAAPASPAPGGAPALSGTPPAQDATEQAAAAGARGGPKAASQAEVAQSLSATRAAARAAAAKAAAADQAAQPSQGPGTPASAPGAPVANQSEPPPAPGNRLPSRVPGAGPSSEAGTGTGKAASKS